MGRRPGLGKETSTSSGFPERHSSVIAPAGHHCNVRSGHLNATFGGKDMGSMAQTGLLLVPSDALGHTWALPLNRTLHSNTQDTLQGGYTFFYSGFVGYSAL